MPLPSEEVITLKLSAANLIYRGIKRINNFICLKNGFFPMDTVLDYSANPLDLFQDIRLEEKDKEIFSLIDGNRKVQDILLLSPLDNLQTMKILYALMNARIIETKEKDQEREEMHEEGLREPEGELDTAFMEQVDELYSKLLTIDHYQILGITQNSTPEEIKKAYFKKAFWEGSYTEAADLFGQAAYLDSSAASYHYYHGMSLAKCKKFREAQEAINKALKLDPLNANYMAELGHIYLELGFHERARATFKRATQLDPTNKRAAEGVQKP